MHRNHRLPLLAGIIALSACLQLSAQNEWHSLLSPVRGVDISSDGSLAIAVGDHGSALVSGKGLATWFRPFVGSYQRLNDVEILSTGLIVVAGEGGFAAFSIDSGQTWKGVQFDSIKNRSILQVAEVGDESEVLFVTRDMLAIVNLVSKETRVVPLPGTEVVSDACFTSTERGFLATEGGIYTTVTGGESWQRILPDIVGVGTDIATTPDGQYVAFSYDDGKQMAVSNDSGSTWQTDLPPAPVSIRRITVSGSGNVLVVGGALNPNLIGSSTAARFLVETSEWIWEGVRPAKPSTVTTAVAIDSSGQGIIGDENGMVLLLEGEGNEVCYVHDPKIRGGGVDDIDFASDSVGLFGVIPISTVRRTEDAGTTWLNSGLQGLVVGLVGFVEPDYGIALRRDPPNLIYITEDQGKAFRPQRIDYPEELPVSAIPVVYSSEITQRGEAVVIASSIGTTTTPLYMLSTSDSLKSLTDENITVESFSFASADFDYPCFGSLTLRSLQDGKYAFRVYRSYDHGRSLELIDDPSDGYPYDWNITVGDCSHIFRAVQLEDTVAWESKHMLLVSTDEGESWRDVHEFDGPVNFTWLTDSVWIVGSNYGRIWTTWDAGSSWTLEKIDPAPYVDFITMRYYPAFTEAYLLPDSTTVLLRGEQGILFRKRLERSVASSVRDVKENGGRVAMLSIVPSVTADRSVVVLPDADARYLSVVDLLGREVYHVAIERGARRVELNLGNVVNGVYQVLALDEAGQQVAEGRVQKL